MKKKYGLLTLAAFFLCASQVAWSAESTAPENNWYWFLGVDLGYSHYSAYNGSTTEAPRGGSDIGLRALVAHYSPDWVIDGGLGYQSISNSGTNSDQTTNKDNTRNAYLDLSPRYRLGKFQIGPEFEYWLNTDNGLNPTTPGSNLITADSNTSAWLGGQAIYEWTGDHKYRLGARVMTVLNATGRTVYLMQGFFEIGFDFFGSSQPEEKHEKNIERINEDDLDRGDQRNQNTPLLMSTPEPTPEPAASPEPQPEPEVMSTPSPVEPDPTPEPAPIVEDESPSAPAKAAPKVVLTLDVNDLPFGFNDAHLPAANAARVKKIGAFLKKNSKTWKVLKVEGYTDERGSKPYNDNLSKLRANTVRNLLIAGGAPAKKIKAIGMGKSHPIDKRHNEKAWAKNRRVELVFHGVKNVVLIKKAMAQ